MTVDELKLVMIFHLKNFANKGAVINDNTVHNTVLSDSDGVGSAHSSRIYRSLIRYTLKKQNHVDPTWPKNWMSMSVADLADELL